MFKQKTIFKHGESVKVASSSCNSSQSNEDLESESLDALLTSDNVELELDHADTEIEPPQKRSKSDVTDIADKVKQSYTG